MKVGGGMSSLWRLPANKERCVTNRTLICFSSTRVMTLSSRKRRRRRRKKKSDDGRSEAGWGAGKSIRKSFLLF